MGDGKEQSMSFIPAPALAPPQILVKDVPVADFLLTLSWG